jgi:putative isomerase
MPENFSAETGVADDQPDTDIFYGWGGLMPLIGINEAIDVTPWNGWEVTPRPHGAPVDWRLGPLLAFGSSCELIAQSGWLTISLDGAARLRTDIATRLRQIAFRTNGIVIETQGAGTVILPGRRVDEIASAQFDGRRIDVVERQGEAAVVLPAEDTPRRLELYWA